MYSATKDTTDGRAALVLVDLQNEVLHPSGRLAGTFPATAGPLLDAVRRLVAWAHDTGVPVIWLRLAFRSEHVDAVLDSMSRRLGTLLEGSWGAELLDDLGRSEHDFVVTKRRPSGFFGTDLALLLHGLGVQRLVVGGVSTNWAVESTVRDGHSHDYTMIVVREAVGTPHTDLHEPSLASMGSVFAEVVHLADVLAGGADRLPGHPGPTVR